MSNKCVAFLCCGDESYVNVMIAGLALARRFNNGEFFIHSNITDQKKLDLIEAFGIKLINQDLTQHFHETNRQWPIEAFHYFASPEILHDLGFDYTVVFDGDVYCCGNLNLSALGLDDYDVAAHRVGSALPDGGDKVFNSGVTIFNNKRLADKSYLSRATAAYDNLRSNKEFIMQNPGGVHDQVVFNALCNPAHRYSRQASVTDPLATLSLSSEWNYLFGRGDAGDLVDLPYDEIRAMLKLAHFSMTNPWKPYDKWGSRNHGMHKTPSFPDGWIFKARGTEPNRNVRMRLANEWRENVIDIQDEYGTRLFADLSQFKLFENEGKT